MKKILFVLGTAREGRNSKKVFDYVLSVASKNKGIELLQADVLDFPQSKTSGLSDNYLIKWRNLVSEADAIVIVAPEYNHGYPGELKLLLDSEYEVYKNKPVAVCGVSGGSFGGVRMVEQLKLVLNALNMIVLNANLYFTEVNSLFDKKGRIKYPEVWDRRVDDMLELLISYTK